MSVAASREVSSSIEYRAEVAPGQAPPIHLAQPGPDVVIAQPPHPASSRMELK